LNTAHLLYRFHASIITLLLGLAASPSASAQSSVTTQNLYDTTPNQPEHYATMLARFRQEPDLIGSVVFLGNSITEGGRWRELLADSTVVNRGISGDNTFGVLNRLDEITRHRPSKLFIMIGVNDISKDIPDEVIADNVRQIINRVGAESPDTRIFVQSLLPVNPDYPGFPQHFAKENHVAHTNRLLREVAVAAGCRFINLFAVFMDQQERMDIRFTYDGLHLNQAGYELWAAYLIDQGYID